MSVPTLPFPLPAGFTITAIGGKQCTGIPRSSTSTAAVQTSALGDTRSQTAGLDTILSTSTTSSSLVISTSTSTSTSTSKSTSTSVSLIASTSTTSISQTTAQVEIPAPVLNPGTGNSLPPVVVSAVSPVSSFVVITSTSTSGASSSLSTNLPSPEASSQTAQTQSPGTPGLQPTQTSQPDASSSTTLVDGQQTQSVSSALNTRPSDTLSTAVLNNPAAANPFLTTLGTVPASTGDAAAAATDSAGSTNSAVTAGSLSTSNTAQSTVAVAGGIVGGVVALGLIAFLIWLWRRRVAKKRRSTLLTPLTTTPSFGRDDGGAYVINRGSIGPTPASEKFRAALRYNFKKLRTRMSALVARNGADSPTMMGRNKPQFMGLAASHSRASSASSDMAAPTTTKERFKDLVSRLAASAGIGSKSRNPRSETSDFLSAAPRGMQEKSKAVLGTQPDFLTLLGMDDRELDREAQRRRASVSRKKGSTASAEHFLGGLNLNFSESDNPFGDENSIAHRSAQPAPLTTGQSSNPFSDNNAIKNPAPTILKPTTYVADIRRSRGKSVSTTRPPSTVYRGSTASVESFETRRNKFRSDPFDLERPELLAGARRGQNSVVSSTAGTAGSSEPRYSRLSGGVGTGEVRKPVGAHTRSESFTSKYSSGVSMGEWSDPGPDVGSGSGRQDRDSSRHVRDPSGLSSSGSQRSVGKAM